MNVTGPTSGLAAVYRPTVARPAAPATAARAASEPTAAAAAEVPAGSDPALWAVLTTEERAFFQQQATMGPLSYSPSSRPAASTAGAPLGQRIDCTA